MTAVIAIIGCTYLAGACAAFGGLNARNGGETSPRMMFFVSCFSWLAFGYIACGGKLESEASAEPAEPIKLSGSTGSSGTPWG